MAFKILGFPCRHFYRVMTLMPTARFHIGLINRCWYKNSLQEIDILSNEFVVNHTYKRMKRIKKFQSFKLTLFDFEFECMLNLSSSIELLKLVLKEVIFLKRN